ncbi:MAG: hypothetical protein NVV59_12840 [Chitinophagaceae bacterium]|nr:hypothetical protein [Chitinophagaceae bacterium]
MAFISVFCVLQIVVAFFFAMQAFAAFLNQGKFMSAVTMVAMFLIAALPAFGIYILNSNFPAVAVDGKQKKNFNRLFLVNVLLLALLFGKVFADLSLLKSISSATGISWFDFPFSINYTFYLSIFLLIGQFVVLYGMFVLRRELYINSMKKKFEFEES